MAKYPCAVRILGNDVDGYRVQYTYNHWRVLPFMTYWFDYEIPIKREGEYSSTWYAVVSDFEVAKKAAMEKYNRLVEAASDEAAKKAARKKAKKILWMYQNG